MTQANAVADWLALAGVSAASVAAQLAGGAKWLSGDDDGGPPRSVDTNPPRSPGHLADRLEARPTAGRRWLWCSQSLPIGRRVAVMTSRIARHVDPYGAWMSGLRESLRRVRDERAVVVTAVGCAGHEIVLRGAMRQASPVVRLYCCDANVAAARTWARRWWASLDQPIAAGVADVWILPSSKAHSPDEPTQAAFGSVPQRDRAAVAWADEVMVLALRSGGNLHALLRHRLTAALGPVVLVDLPGLQSKRARDELVQLGASLWSVRGGGVDRVEPAKFDGAPPTASPAPIVPAPAPTGWPYLTHCTRAREGPWPDQSPDDYLDGLFDASGDVDHSALATLVRIATQRRLIASSRTIRGRFGVVSFTAAPLGELARLRVFRAHRSRWDFEPYGLCVRREWLAQRGARPVRYGSDDDWRSLPDADRPFFQLVRTGEGAARGSPIDWRVEAEWRHVGDLDLSDLPGGDGLMFAPNEAEAACIARISRWPVCVAPAAER